MSAAGGNPLRCLSNIQKRLHPSPSPPSGPLISGRAVSTGRHMFFDSGSPPSHQNGPPPETKLDKQDQTCSRQREKKERKKNKRGGEGKKKTGTTKPNKTECPPKRRPAKPHLMGILRQARSRQPADGADAADALCLCHGWARTGSSKDKMPTMPHDLPIKVDTNCAQAKKVYLIDTSIARIEKGLLESLSKDSRGHLLGSFDNRQKCQKRDGS